MPYSRCAITGWVPVQDGLFEILAPVMIDQRSYMAELSFKHPGYLENKWEILIDSSFVDSEQIDTSIILVKESERALGGISRF